MSIEAAEKLKRELTDKYVVVVDGVPELRRFAGLTGTVKTVNMNGRALVQFDGPVDITWYDIAPDYLRVIDAPLPKKAAEPAAKGKPVTSAPSPKPAAPKPAAAGGKKSPLELAREQAAAKAAGASAAPAPAPAAAPGKKLSPLEMARMQGAKKAEGSGETAAATPAAGGKKLSPLEMARQQGAAKKEEASVAVDEPAATAPAESNGDGATEAAAPATPAKASSAPAVGPDGKKLSPLELARRQGAFKGK